MNHKRLDQSFRSSVHFPECVDLLLQLTSTALIINHFFFILVTNWESSPGRETLFLKLSSKRKKEKKNICKTHPFLVGGDSVTTFLRISFSKLQLGWPLTLGYVWILKHSDFRILNNVQENGKRVCLSGNVIVLHT